MIKCIKCKYWIKQVPYTKNDDFGQCDNKETNESISERMEIGCGDIREHLDTYKDFGCIYGEL